MMTFCRLVPESIRWLVSKNQDEKALKIIKKIAKFNNIEVPKHLIEDHEIKVSYYIYFFVLN